MDIPWVHLVWESYYSNGSLPSRQRKGSFWWRDNLRFLDSFNGLARVNVQDGASCLLWEDLWNDHVPKIHFPELFSFAKDTSISLKNAKDATCPASLLHLPISQIALQQLNELAQLLVDLPIFDEHDYWTYIWGNSFYSASKAYVHLIGHRHTDVEISMSK